jgi:putative tryptophan/tyrosine transport system substrate-binding protein
MRRREFITMFGGAAAAWPFAAWTQHAAMPVIGLLHSASPGPFQRLAAAFREGLKEKGYVEGQNIAIEQRWAEGAYDRLPALAAELVGRGVVVLATMGGEGPALAARAATSTIPIVFVSGGDPVKLGLVASINRPGGNVTGINQFTTLLEKKRLGLLHDLVPGADPIAVLINPTRSVANLQRAEIAEAAAQLGVKPLILTATREAEFEPAFAVIAVQRIGGLLCAADPFFFSRRAALVALTMRHRVPAIFEFRDFVDAGGLMSYGTDLADSYRQCGSYVGRLLKGERPSELPVMQSTKFETVINLKTAKALGIKISDNLLSLADEAIE